MDNYNDFTGLVNKSRMVELVYAAGIENIFPKLRALKPDLIISVGIRLNSAASETALALSQYDIDTLHFYADNHGNELDTENPRFLKEMIREIHMSLVNNLTRQKIKLVFSGGIAMAEHMAKAIICGADGITIDSPLLIALECRICYRCKNGLSCPVKIGDVDPGWGCQRILNLIGAWRNQLLEVMGAMGIREARRLCGEVGRSMWFYDLEKDNFGPIFGERKIEGLGR
jgi:hypothetical protein